MKVSLVSDVTGVLLAGGKSRRMGQDKRVLAVGDETLFVRSLAVLRSVFQRVLIVIAQDSPPIETDAIVLRDLIPECGSLGGLYTGLKEAHTEWVFAAACDMREGVDLPPALTIIAQALMLILPQQKKQKQQKAMMEGLKKGDKVITASGIWGTVTNLGKDTVTLQIADNAKIKMQREYIARVRTEEDDKDA